MKTSECFIISVNNKMSKVYLYIGDPVFSVSGGKKNKCSVVSLFYPVERNYGAKVSGFITFGNNYEEGENLYIEKGKEFINVGVVGYHKGAMCLVVINLNFVYINRNELYGNEFGEFKIPENESQVVLLWGDYHIHLEGKIVDNHWGGYTSSGQKVEDKILCKINNSSKDLNQLGALLLYFEKGIYYPVGILQGFYSSYTVFEPFTNLEKPKEEPVFSKWRKFINLFV
jgi:hypothetical protein